MNYTWLIHLINLSIFCLIQICRRSALVQDSSQVTTFHSGVHVVSSFYIFVFLCFIKMTTSQVCESKWVKKRKVTAKMKTFSSSFSFLTYPPYFLNHFPWFDPISGKHFHLGRDYIRQPLPLWQSFLRCLSGISFLALCSLSTLPLTYRVLMYCSTSIHTSD